MKRAVLSLALLLSVQIGMPGFARADDAEDMSLAIAGHINETMHNDSAPHCDGDRGGRREGYWGGGGGRDGWDGGRGGRDGWDGGRGGYGRGSWTCIAQNNYGSAYSAVAYDQYAAQREALQACNRYTVFGGCYVSRCY